MYDDDIIDDIQERIDELVGLNEITKEASTKNEKLQLQENHLYDKKVVARQFELEDLILMWNARIEDKGKHGKLDQILAWHILDRIHMG